MNTGNPQRFELRQGDVRYIHNTIFDGKYFTPSEEGARFCDLLTQEPLQPGRVPPSVAADALCSRGLEYLRRRGEKSLLTIHLLLSYHREAANFERMAEQYPDVMSASRVMGVEMDWVANGGTTEPLPEQAELRLAEPGGRRDFQQAQLAWLKEHDTVPLPCEQADDCGSDLAQAITRMWDLYNETATLEEDPPIRNAARHLANRLHQSFRQWAVLGQLGWWLERLDNAGRLAQGHIAVPVMLGSWHENSARRLESLSVPVETCLSSEEETPEMKSRGQAYMRCALDMRAGMDLLRTPLPY